MGLTLSWWGSHQEHKDMPRLWLGSCRTYAFSLEPPSHLLKDRGWDTLQPVGGLECCAWVGSWGVRPTLHSSGVRVDCLSLSGSWALGKGLWLPSAHRPGSPT